MNKITLLLVLILTTSISFAQKKASTSTQPKLVVGLVVDQMRYDYLTRFYNKYGDGGFKRLINQGYNLQNTHYNYIPTYTAVGHTSIFAGTTPSNHGIIGNNWYDKFAKKSVYCVDDANFETIGTTTKNGKKSPYRLHTTTVTDQLRMAQNMKGKTIGIAIKDRSAILPVGHTATAAYWFDGGNHGKWISSSYYMDKLPKWVAQFNRSKTADDYLNKPWETLLPIESYTESIEDNNAFEGKFRGEETPTFPHDLPKLRKTNRNFNLLKAVPFGNSITNDFAMAAIIGENLGKNEYTDFLTISYSSTDYVGHQFGVDSKEIEDTYIRLDKDLEKLLLFLDNEVGKDNYTLFLTADHAAVQVPSYLNSLKIPGGYIDTKELKNFVNNITLEKFGSSELVENISNFQIFLNKEKLKELKLNVHTVSQAIADEVINFDKIYKSVTALTLQTSEFRTGLLNLLQQGYNQKFSGDVLLIPTPSTISYSRTGSTHGSGYSYDTHVPLLFYGKGIKQGKSSKHYRIVDIAPTLANLLQIEFPNGNTGEIIEEVME